MKTTAGELENTPWLTGKSGQGKIDALEKEKVDLL